MREPINHPCVWKGSQLEQSPHWNDVFRRDWITSDGGISPAFKDFLLQVQHELEVGRGAVLLKNFPVEEFDDNALSEIFLKIGSVVGTPVSQSAKGERVFSVRNEGFTEDDPRARGPNTKKKLSFHTDRCDVIAFLCVKQAKSGGENQVVSSAAIFNEILDTRPDLIDVLCQPFFYQRHNVDAANAKPYTLQPIFSYFKGYFASNFLRVLIERAYQSNDVPKMTALQREALDYLEAVAARPNMHFEFRQNRGDILFLNNWVTYHRRTEFEDFDDIQMRRHLLRIWLSVPNSRPVDPMFSGNYGATNAGAVRGGMNAIND